MRHITGTYTFSPFAIFNFPERQQQQKITMTPKNNIKAGIGSNGRLHITLRHWYGGEYINKCEVEFVVNV